MGTRVWVPKPVYRAPKWPGYVTVNVCCTDEITKLQMKEVSNDKEINEISKKKLCKASKQKKQVLESYKLVKSDQKNG